MGSPTARAVIDYIDAIQRAADYWTSRGWKISPKNARIIEVLCRKQILKAK